MSRQATPPATVRPLDRIDRRILRTLQADGRDEHELAARLTRRYARLRRMLGLELVLPSVIRIRSMGG